MKAVYKGETIFIDYEDLTYLLSKNWSIARKPNSSYLIHVATQTYFHRSIMVCPDGYDVDHINRNGLDNRKENLRIVLRRVNLQNAPARSASGYKGVSPYRDKWRAAIVFNGTQIHLGVHKDATIAATHYDMAAIYLYGGFCAVNFPERMEEYLNQLKRLEKN